jgi:hypothetical protein
MNLRDFDKIERKLGMETRDSSHHHAWFVHNGVTVARTKRSHGNNKFVPEDQIRKQLHVNQDQFLGLISCAVSKEEYIKILIEKGIICETSKTEEQPLPGKIPPDKMHGV